MTTLTMASGYISIGVFDTRRKYIRAGAAAPPVSYFARGATIKFDWSYGTYTYTSGTYSAKKMTRWFWSYPTSYTDFSAPDPSATFTGVTL